MTAQSIVDLQNRYMEDVYPTRGRHSDVIERLDPVVYWQQDSGLAGQSHARLERFERDGYLLLSGLFHPAETVELLEQADLLRERAAWEKPHQAFFESGTDAVRSIFAVHQASEAFAALCRDSRVLDLVCAILGDDVYVHQSRLNYKPAFRGRNFYWHSDFETWHAEDGMPRMRAVSLSVSLTPSLATNGPLMVIPGSHRTFVSCVGRTPPDHYRRSLIKQELGTPDESTIADMAKRRGIKALTGGAGSAVLFDCNLMHASVGNITPFPRTHLFVVYNAVSNRLVEPYGGTRPRPEFIGARDSVQPPGGVEV